jgi:hypothetical protein
VRLNLREFDEFLPDGMTKNGHHSRLLVRNPQKNQSARVLVSVNYDYIPLLAINNMKEIQELILEEIGRKTVINPEGTELMTLVDKINEIIRKINDSNIQYSR